MKEIVFELLTLDADSRNARLVLPLIDSLPHTQIQTVYPDVIDAWYPTEGANRLVALNGMLEVVVFDPRQASNTFGQISQFVFGSARPAALNIPDGYWLGWRSVIKGEGQLLIQGTAPFPDAPNLSASNDKIPFDWSR